MYTSIDTYFCFIFFMQLLGNADRVLLWLCRVSAASVLLGNADTAALTLCFCDSNTASPAAQRWHGCCDSATKVSICICMLYIYTCIYYTLYLYCIAHAHTFIRNVASAHRFFAIDFLRICTSIFFDLVYHSCAQLFVFLNLFVFLQIATLFYEVMNNIDDFFFCGSARNLLHVWILIIILNVVQMR